MKKKKTVKLRECRLCGGKPDVLYSDGPFVWCSRCYHEGACENSVARASRVWNARPKRKWFVVGVE